jgi:hypothetical protein
MREYWYRHALNIFREHEVATGNHGNRACHEQQRLGPAWRCANRDGGMGARGFRKIHAIPNDIGFHRDRLHAGLHAGECGGIHDRTNIGTFAPSCHTIQQHLLLSIAPRIADA